MDDDGVGRAEDRPGRDVDARGVARDVRLRSVRHDGEHARVVHDLDARPERSVAQELDARDVEERAEGVGGSLRLESEPGQGTRIFVDVPLGLS